MPSSNNEEECDSMPEGQDWNRKDRNNEEDNVVNQNELSDEEESDPMPGLQNRNREDSSSDKENVEELNEASRNRNEDRFEKSETWKERKQISIPEWKQKDTNTDTKLNDGNNEKTTLRLRGGGIEVETVPAEENDEETINHKDSRLEEERISQPNTSVKITMQPQQ